MLQQSPLSGLRAFMMLPILVVVGIAALLKLHLDASPVLWMYDGVIRYLGLPRRSLANQTIWITGASGGIGAAVVCELAQLVEPPRHLILSARNVERMHHIVNQCQHDTTTTTTTFSVVAYDAMDTESTFTVVQQAIESSPTQSIDMLVQVSGIYQSQPALETSADYRYKLFRINVQAPIELSQALILQNGWKERQYGHLVIISSIMAKGPQSLSSTYGATKVALKSYFASLSCEEWLWLDVTNILPGATDTPLWQNAETAPDIRPDSGTLMTPQRVAQLIVTTMAARHKSSVWTWWFFYEVWICQIEALLYGYLSHFAPTLFYFTNHLVGLARVEAWHTSHQDMLELPALIQTAIQVLLRKVRQAE